VQKNHLENLFEGQMHRLLSLELELRDLYRAGHLDESQYQKRVRHTKNSKNKLLQLQSFLLNSRDKEVSPASMTAQEWQIINMSVKMHSRYLDSLWAPIKKIKKWMQRLVMGKSTRWINLKFSWIRRALIQTENNFKVMQQEHKRLEHFFRQLEQSILSVYPNLQVRSHPKEKVKQILSILDCFNDEILKLRLEKSKLDEELNWMELWLSYQKQRIIGYRN
jgi:hypothetical protein